MLAEAEKSRRLGRIHLIFILCAFGFWISVNVPPWRAFGNVSIAGVILGWLVNGNSWDPVFPFTLGAAMITALVSLWRFRITQRFLWLPSTLLAATTPFAFVGTFEALYQNLAYFARPGIFHTGVPGEILLASWIIVGFSTMPFWKESSLFYGLLALDLVGFALWALVGYPQFYDASNLATFALVVNILTKCGFALTVLSLIYAGTVKKEKRLLTNALFRNSPTNWNKKLVLIEPSQSHGKDFSRLSLRPLTLTVVSSPDEAGPKKIPQQYLSLSRILSALAK